MNIKGKVREKEVQPFPGFGGLLYLNDVNSGLKEVNRVFHLESNNHPLPQHHTRFQGSFFGASCKPGIVKGKVKGFYTARIIHIQTCRLQPARRAAVHVGPVL